MHILLLKLPRYPFEQCSRLLPISYAQFMLHMQSIMLYKFNIFFLLSYIYLNYKIMSISSPLSSLQASTQLTIRLYTYAYKHFEFIFVAFATLVDTCYEN